MPIRPALAAAALLLLLAGCVQSRQPTPKPEFGIPTSTATATPRPTATVTPTPGPETEPVEFGCSDLLPAQAIYDYNPNVSLLSDFAPTAESLAGQAVAQQGIACRLINQTSGVTIDIGVVRFTDAAYSAKLAAATASSSPTSAFDGFFDVTGEGGVAQAFSAPYWISISSGDFVAAGDATELVSAAVDGL